MAELVFHRSGERLLRLPIDRDRFRIGRGDDNHFSIADDDLASTEVVFELREEGWWLVDASGRGNKLDAGIVRTEAPLTDGAVLHLGKQWTATFCLGHPTSPGETRRYAGQTLAKAGDLAREELELSWESPAGPKTIRVGLGDTVGIGQNEDNQVVIQDEFVSAFHARVFNRNNQWKLSDLDSTNGTFLDEIGVHDAVLEPGMKIRVGETAISVTDAAGYDHQGGSTHLYGIVTADPAFKAVLEQIERLGSTDATVAVFGESGTGKELVARAIHDASTRASGPFIPVNCAAISKELMESEIFGHEKGAFTGAATARAGAFEEADGGTLFLDEIGELPLDLQAKLLRAIELKEVRRVGASRTITVDVRIVAATNRDLHSEVRAGRFREDLFYRLYVVPLTLPPLRRRPADIPLLVEHFLTTRSPGRPPVLSDEAKAKLEEHSWPGNVRELRNTIERAILFHTNGRIEAKDIIFPQAASISPLESTIEALGKTLSEIESEAIRIALRTCGGNRRMTARALGIARSTLQNKLKDLGLAQPDSDEV